jgi:hypothetical protein
MILREVKAEIIELITNLTFARNLSLTMMIAIASLYGLAELQSQNAQFKLANFATANKGIANITNAKGR